jgi:hypothetical protein
MTSAFDCSNLRAVVKNTFVHFERVDESFDASDHPCKLMRRVSDAIDVRTSFQHHKLFEVDAPLTVEVDSSDNESLDGVGADTTQTIDIDSVRTVVKNTFVHFEYVNEDCSDISPRRFRRHRTDILHARDVDAQGLEFPKGGSISDSNAQKIEFADSLSINSKSVHFERMNEDCEATQESTSFEADAQIINYKESVKSSEYLDAEPSCSAIKSIFVHRGHLIEDCREKGQVKRRIHKHHTDILHARDADAQAYKFAKQESTSYECGQYEDSMHSDHSELEPSCVSIKKSAVLIPSIGSSGHSEGLCRPCVWFLRPGSCNKGVACEYCHLCDDVALARLAEVKQCIKKLKKRYNRARARRQAGWNAN